LCRNFISNSAFLREREREREREGGRERGRERKTEKEGEKERKEGGKEGRRKKELEKETSHHLCWGNGLLERRKEKERIRERNLSPFVLGKWLT
jgi:hypothetical protein